MKTTTDDAGTTRRWCQLRKKRILKQKQQMRGPLKLKTEMSEEKATVEDSNTAEDRMLW